MGQLVRNIGGIWPEKIFIIINLIIFFKKFKNNYFNMIFSAIPPVKSLSPSRLVPYLSASYEPCNLEKKSN